MSGLNIALEGLDLNHDQFMGLIGNWYLAGFLDETNLRHALNDYLRLDGDASLNIQNTLKQCISVHNKPIKDRTLADFDANLAAQLLFKDDHKAGAALAFIQLMQQNYFTKGDRKEVDAVKKTEHTNTHQKEIENVAKQLGMFDANPLNNKVDLALVIGARAMTIPGYLNNVKAGIDEGLISQVAILLSSRPLVTGKKNNTDNPQKTSETLPFDDAKGDYQAYLQNKYPDQPLTEGLSMRDSFKRIFGKTLETAQETRIFHIISNTPNSVDFYKTAIQNATEQKRLLQGGKIAVFGIQPYLKNYQAQAEDIIRQMPELKDRNITVSGHGNSGNRKPEILAQAIAMYINSKYPCAKCKIENTVKTTVLPREYLQLGSRDQHAKTLTTTESNIILLGETNKSHVLHFQKSKQVSDKANGSDKAQSLSQVESRKRLRRKF